MKTPQTVETRLNKAFGEEKASQIAEILERNLHNRLSENASDLIVKVINGETVDIEAVTIRKKREMSQETKQKNYQKQLEKLQKKYGIKGE